MKTHEQIACILHAEAPNLLVDVAAVNVPILFDCFLAVTLNRANVIEEGGEPNFSQDLGHECAPPIYMLTILCSLSAYKTLETKKPFWVSVKMFS